MIQKNWQELIKPNKLEVVPGNVPERQARIVAEPLERGFGLTLGNALRRVLLSSLQGSAVTAIQIDGVLHEFSSIPGVHEDVTDIVLNIKSMGLRMYSEGASGSRSADSVRWKVCAAMSIRLSHGTTQSAPCSMQASMSAYFRRTSSKNAGERVAASASRLSSMRVRRPRYQAA